MTHKERVASLMLHLKCTEAEAEDIIAYDAQVDKGEPTKYDLTPEQMKITKKEREIDFKVGETEFTVMLTQHRAKK